MFFLPLLTTLLAITTTPVRAGPGAYFGYNNSPSTGYTSLSAKYFIDPASNWTTGYYASTEWHFTGHDDQYFGLQPRSPGGKTTGHLVYSVFGKGSTVGDPARCSGGADGGSGVSCSYDIDLSPGQWYTIESTVVERKPDGSQRWNGTLVADSTGVRTYIASFWTDASYGNLKGDGMQWLEWYRFNGDGLTPATRPCQPYFKVHYGVPTLSDGTVTTTMSSLFGGSLDDECAVTKGTNNYRSSKQADGSLLIEAGILD